MAIRIPNLLIIAGTGTNSGKTTLACRIIEQSLHHNPVAIKITPHFHETTPGLDLITEGKGYSVYREKNAGLTKDTSRMLKSGARNVFFAKVNDNTLFEAFKVIMSMITGSPPVICESPALRYYVEPGLFIIMSSNAVEKQKDISNLQKLSHVKLTYEELGSHKSVPVEFTRGLWIRRE